MSRSRLVIVTTHPIQYHTPWFRALSATAELDLQVWFCHNATPREQSEAGFGVEFDWDRSLLDGFSHRFLKNVSSAPSVNSYSGVDTPELKTLIPDESPDAVLVNGWHYKSAWQAIRTCWRTRIPVMARSDSHLRTKRSPAKRLIKWPYYRWFIPRLDACLAVGAWSRDYFLHYGARADQIFTVPHTVDTEFFVSSSSTLRSHRDEIRAKFGLPGDAVVYLFVGKFIEKKRPLDFVKAVELARQDNPTVAGLMVGDGPLRTATESYVNERNIPIHFTGFLNQSQIVEAYVAADALVLPSDGGETWGMVVNEAMTCGLPCFVSDHVGCGSDLITKTEAGYVFELGQFQRLGKLLQSFASDANRRQEMSKRAKNAIANYTSNKAVAGTLAAVDSVKASAPRT